MSKRHDAAVAITPPERLRPEACASRRRRTRSRRVAGALWWRSATRSAAQSSRRTSNSQRAPGRATMGAPLSSFQTTHPSKRVVAQRVAATAPESPTPAKDSAASSSICRHRPPRNRVNRRDVRWWGAPGQLAAPVAHVSLSDAPDLRPLQPDGGEKP
jgi:hypothetical protein